VNRDGGLALEVLFSVEKYQVKWRNFHMQIGPLSDGAVAGESKYV
jgi:hypothetical protein